MSTSADRVPAARLSAAARPVLSAAGFDLEDLTVTAAGRRSVVRVLVDRDGGITLDDVAVASRVVSDALDVLDEKEPDLLGESYVLEVSSPGVSRPLTEPRHFRRNVGRLVTLALTAGGEASGRIVAADEAGLTVDGPGGRSTTPYAEVLRGAVQVEFTHAAPDEADEDEQ